MKNTTSNQPVTELELAANQRLAPLPAAIPSPITILEAAVKGGITAENVAVVKELTAMCREQQAMDNKVAFNKAMFRLKTEISTLDLYRRQIGKGHQRHGCFQILFRKGTGR